MTRILSRANATATTKAYETGNYLYFNGVAHNKGNMSTIPFVPFTNGATSSNIAFSDLLVPAYRQKYWNSIIRNNLILDVNNSNSYFFSDVQTANNSVTYGRYNYFSKVTEKVGFDYRSGSKYKSHSYYRFGDAFTGMLGNDSSYIYGMVCEGGYENSYESNVTPYPPTHTSYPMKATLTYMSKASGSVTYEVVAFSNSSGAFKVLRETPTNIYFIIEKSGYQYDFCNFSKNDRQVTTVSTFSALTDNLYTNSSSGGVAPSDLIKLSEDVFETYISGQLTITGQDGATTYKNVISKATINIEESTVEIKQIELDEEPQFKHAVAQYYNNIYIMEQNNKRFLVATIYTPYDMSLSKEDTIIQVYELDESDADNLRGTLVQTIKQKDINGIFHGVLQVKSNHLFMSITSATTLAFKFSISDKKFKILDLGMKGLMVGRDTNDNFFLMNSATEVHIFNDENLYNLKLEMPTDDFTYENADIETTIKISAKDIQDEYMNLQVRLVITGNAKFKNEDAQAIITNTETTGVKEIPIVITGGGNVKITPFVKL